MNKVPHQQRTKLLVDRKLQVRFAMFVMAFAVGTAFLTSAIVFFTTFSLMGEKLASVYPPGRLKEIYESTYLIFGGVLIVMLPGIFYMSLRFSHQIVGPLPKIYRTLRSIGDGDFNQSLTLRKGDKLTELAQVINEMAAHLKSRYGSPANH